MRRKNYTKLTKIIYDSIKKSHLKNVIIKNSINFIFLKRLRILEKKNLIINYNFYNFFLKNYKNYNLLLLKLFYYNNFNKKLIFTKTNLKNQFMYNINNLKNFFSKKRVEYLFLKKNLNFNYYLNNCYLFNETDIFNILDENFFKNFEIINLNNNFINNDSQNNLIYFFNFNIYIFNIVEVYKYVIILLLFNLYKN